MDWPGIARQGLTIFHPIILHEGIILHVEFLAGNAEFDYILD